MKVKLKLLTAVCLVLVLILCVACNTSNNDSDSSDDSEDATEYYEENTEDYYEDSEEVMYDEDGDGSDELEQLRTEIASDGEIYLLRNGNAYTLNNHLYKVDGINYFSGTSYATGAILIYDFACQYGDNYLFRSIGDIPVPVLQEGDTIVAHSDANVTNLTLKKVSFYGDCIGFYHALPYDDEFFNYTHEESVEYDDPDTGKTCTISGVSDVQVKDADGEPVDDYLNLTYDECYTASWYMGTEYQEVTLRANNKAYTYEPGVDSISMYDPDYELEPELTEEGAVYDLSEVPPGLYVTGTSPQTTGGGHGLIEIQ